MINEFDVPPSASSTVKERDPRLAPSFYAVLKLVTLQRNPKATRPLSSDILQALRHFALDTLHLEALTATAEGRRLHDSLTAVESATQTELLALLETAVPDGLRLTIGAGERPLLSRLLAVEPALSLLHLDVFSRWQSQRMFQRLHAAALTVPGQEAVAPAIAADLALQLSDPERQSAVRCLLHGHSAWGSAELAMALSDALVAHQGYTVLDIDCSSYRSEGEAASWDGAKAFWSGSAPGEVTSFIHHHPKAVIVFHRIDETLPKVMAALRGALANGQMVDGHGLDEGSDREEQQQRRKHQPTPVDASQAVFIFTAEHASQWLQHAQVDTVLGETQAQRRANLLGELMSATREHRGEQVALFDAAVLRAMATHHHLLQPQSWAVLQQQAVAQWPHLETLARRYLGQALEPATVDDVDDLMALLLLKHGAGVALGHTRAEALYRAWLQPLQAKRMNARDAGRPAQAATLRVGLSAKAREQWRALQRHMGEDPVRFLRRQNVFAGLEFSESDGVQAGWWLSSVRLQPVRSLSDYLGVSGMISRVPQERLDDVCGHPDVKRHLRGVLAQLKAPEQLARYGVNPPRGVVLHGPPGTGKTLLARALAGEAQLPFITVTGTELLDGGTLRRVYEVAHRNEPCVIHIDEADALGRRGSKGALHDAAINFLLSKIDGFAQHKGVFHVLTTNRPDELDAALTRPGRIEHQFEIGPLDREGRRQQLERLWPLLQVADDQRADAQQRLVEQTYGMTGAELAQVHAEVVRQALAGRLDSPADGADPPLLVAVDDALGVISRLRFGDVVKRQADEDFRLRVAVHEAGHALAHHLLLPELPVLQVTIVPRGDSEGFVAHGDDHEHRIVETPTVIRSYLVMLLAGRAAEIKRFGADGPSSGAISDLARATQAAHKAVAVSGMDEIFGQISLAGMGKAVSEKLLEQAEDRTRHWIEQATSETFRFLHKHSAAHDALAAALLERETLDGHEVADIVRKALAPKSEPTPLLLLLAANKTATLSTRLHKESDHV